MMMMGMMVICTESCSSHQTDTPIFTMTLPGQKMYVVTTPELI
jgi:hypothetical protein